MVTVRLAGGLGNQMFEYAAGRALALRVGGDLRIDPTLIEFPGRHETPRSVALNVFRIAGTIEGAEQSAFRRSLSYSPVATRLADRLPGKFLADRTPYKVDARVIRCRGSAVLSGYWQREEYFRDAAEVIRQEFTPAVPPDRRWSDMADEIAQAGSVGIHVRRGDYVSNARANAHHGVPGVEYVQRAWELLAPPADARPFVFSDDPGWCKDNLRFLPDPVFVEGFRDHEEMLLLGRCRDKIIANSSFSWWAAWLGEREDGTVIAPAAWLQGKAPDAPSPVPARWGRC